MLNYIAFLGVSNKTNMFFSTAVINITVRKLPSLIKSMMLKNFGFLKHFVLFSRTLSVSFANTW